MRCIIAIILICSHVTVQFIVHCGISTNTEHIYKSSVINDFVVVDREKSIYGMYPMVDQRKCCALDLAISSGANR